MKDFLIAVTFLAMVISPAFVALNVFRDEKNRF